MADPDPAPSSTLNPADFLPIPPTGWIPHGYGSTIKSSADMPDPGAPQPFPGDPLSLVDIVLFIICILAVLSLLIFPFICAYLVWKHYCQAD